MLNISYSSLPYFSFPLAFPFQDIFPIRFRISMGRRKSRKLVSLKGMSFRPCQIVGEGEGWYLVDDGVRSSSASESASVHAGIRTGDHHLRKMSRKRKRLLANADDTKIQAVVKETLKEIVDLIGEK